MQQLYALAGLVYAVGFMAIACLLVWLVVAGGK